MEPSHQLIDCLSRALADSHLAGDIASACSLAGISVDSIASGEDSESQLAEKLFLTAEEVANLVYECKQARGKVSVATPAKPVLAEAPDQSLMLHDVDSPRLASPKRMNPRQENSNNLPSYLRHTEASRRKPEVIEDHKPQSVKVRISHSAGNRASVFAPTAAFLARMSVKGAGQRTAEKNSAHQKSMATKIMTSPQGQRVTTPVPFALGVSQKPKEVLLSTEDEIILEAQKARETWKPIPLPKHVQDSRPVEGVIATIREQSRPKTADPVFKPFNLASEQRHQAERKKFEAVLAAQKEEEEQQRIFKARKVAKSRPCQKTSAPIPPTVPQAPSMISSERLARAEELKQLKRAKMSEEDRLALEERERLVREEKALKEMQIKQDKDERQWLAEIKGMSEEQLRRQLVFKARPLPGFDNVFHPQVDHKATQPDEFNFKTDARMGKPQVRTEEGTVQLVGDPQKLLEASLRSPRMSPPAAPKTCDTFRVVVASPRSPREDLDSALTSALGVARSAAGTPSRLSIQSSPRAIAAA